MDNHKNASAIKNFTIKYFPDALVNLLLIVGSLCGFLSAFEFIYDMPVTIVVFFLASLFLTFICHQDSVKRLLGYLGLMVVYFAGVFSAGEYLNTGFYYIINNIIDDMTLYLGVGNYQEYNLLISNTSDSITLLNIFLGVFLLIIINIMVSERKSMLGSIFFTLPLLLIPIYIHREPGVFWVICLISGYLLIFAYKHLTKLQRNFRNLTLERAKLFLAAVTFSFVGITAVLMNLIFPKDTYDLTYMESTAKMESYDNVGNFLMFGLSGFFNSYNGAGGMSGGKLGGIYAVRPDYETDLIIEFTPYANETLYLKGFTGILYTGHEWLNQEDTYNETRILTASENTDETFDLDISYEEGAKNAAKALLRITNVGAVSTYDYVPYYSTSMYKTTKDGSDEYTFYPYHDVKFSSAELSDDEEDIYLQIPDDNLDTLETICEDGDIKGSTEDVIQEITTYFADNYTYTLSPGKTPSKEDFVNYFLSDSKKGYCSHFASAAVLLLRYNGIPARYVEGYALPTVSMEDGTILENKNYDDYYSGYNELGETNVLQCEINDSQAHAWVEYFDEDFGWRIAEFTPPSDESAMDSSGFFEMISQMLSGRNNTSITVAANNQTTTTNTAENITRAITENSAAILWSIVYILLSFVIAMMLVLFIRFRMRYYSSNKRRNILNLYGAICEKVRRNHPEFSGCYSHLEQLQNICNWYDLTEKSIVDASTLEYIAYGNEEDDSLAEFYKGKKYKELRRTLFLMKRKIR